MTSQSVVAITVPALRVFFFACYVSINYFFLLLPLFYVEVLMMMNFTICLSVTEYSSAILTGINSDGYDDYRTLLSVLLGNDSSVYKGYLRSVRWKHKVVRVVQKLNVVERYLWMMNSLRGGLCCLLYLSPKPTPFCSDTVTGLLETILPRLPCQLASC